MKVVTNRRAGLLGLVGLVALGLVVLVLSVVSFGKTTYTAQLEHTAGLRVGEEVQVAGVGVGEVTGVKLAGHHVDVRFTLDSDVRLGRSTTVAVKVATLLGTHFLDVAPKGTGELPDDTIVLSRTSVPYNLQDVVDGTSAALDELDEKKLASSMDVVADVLGQSSDETRAAVKGVADLSRVAAKRSDQLAALLRATHDVTGGLVKNRDRIIDLLGSSTLVLAELTKRRDAIDAMLSDSRRLAQQVTGLLDDTSADLDPLMKNLTTALDSLEKSKKDVTSALDGLSTMSRYVANASGNGPWLDLFVPVAINDNVTCSLKPGCAQ